MVTIPYWHVDAFAARPFAGNQAAVMLLDSWPGDDVLAAIAAEHMFAATAFLVKDRSDASDYEIRWFTPSAEIRLCGHATLAAGHVLLDHLEKRSGRLEVALGTRKAGTVIVRRDGPNYLIELPKILTKRCEWAGAGILLGAAPLEVWRSDDRHCICLFSNENQVRALRPDMAGLAAIGNDQFICTSPGKINDIVSRVFVPGGGVDEDSVTGSAHAALAPFWAQRIEKNRFSAHQASARGGDLTCTLDGDRVWLGGQCTTVVQGEFYLTG